MKIHKKNTTRNMIFSAMFMAIGLVLPIFTGQLHSLGNMLLPMHLPVMLCGFICGWKYGLAVGFILPILRSVLFSKPVLYPDALGMAFELMTYGAMVGLIYYRAKNKGLEEIYISLIVSMIAGRLVWGIAKVVLLGFVGKTITAKALIAGGFLNGIPGIVIQLVLVQVIVFLVDKYTPKASE